MKRIQRLPDPRPHGVLAPILAAAILISTAAVTLAARQAKPSQQIPALVPPQERALPLTSSRWVDGPVSYLITSQEHIAFLQLASNEEREMFIEQFWARRNPQPGSAKNIFKEEFYRRVAYADQHFASAIPGWKTDRGYIYICYGPPDKIGAYPKGARSPYIVQIWIYQHIPWIGDNGSITFVDRTGEGDFRITPGTGSIPKSGNFHGTGPESENP